MSDPGADLDSLRQAVASGDSAARLRAMGSLRPYPAEVCEPLLLTCLADKTVLVRSMACSGLGFKPTPAGTLALRRMIADEPDPNVRAEAANALARHGGEQASEPLLALYRRDAHWLVRRSIVAALADEAGVPAGVLAELADLALADDDVHLQLGLPAGEPPLAHELHQSAAMDDYGDALVRPPGRGRGQNQGGGLWSRSADELMALDGYLSAPRPPQR